MNDITLLGITCVGLGLYCIHLHNRIRKVHNAGQFLTEMMVRYIVDNEDCSLPEAAKIIQKLSIQTITRKKIEALDEEQA
jgi:hypothetical protein